MRRSYTKIKYFVLTSFPERTQKERNQREKSKREKYCPKDFDNLKKIQNDCIEKNFSSLQNLLENVFLSLNL
jgi:hypothetical protein